MKGLLLALLPAAAFNKATREADGRKVRRFSTRDVEMRPIDRIPAEYVEK